MGIVITCEKCRASYSVGEKFAGRTAKCLKCQSSISIPKTEPSANVPQTPPEPPAAKTAAQSVRPANPNLASREQLIQEIRQPLLGEIRNVKLPFSYQLGLLCATLVMLLLVLTYFLLLLLATWGVYWHATHNYWLFTTIHNARVAIFGFAIYLVPLIAGPIVVLFLIKPLFARSGMNIPPVSLKREQEPLLFEFVEKIARAVGAPVPRRIDVDVNVNASAAFRKGVWSMLIGSDLVLTIGLPLVAGLNTRQLGGVIAHELGHFRQGAGMRMSYLIRRISFWFTIVVCSQDSWDIHLKKLAESEFSPFRILGVCVLGCVWGTRKLLWALMVLGHLTSGFLMRQMEFDADRCETLFGGSETFEQTARALPRLYTAFRGAIADLRNFYFEGRLGDNFPRLLMHKAEQLPQEVKDILEKQLQETKTEKFDTHPCDSDRIAAAKALNAPGVFRVERPSLLLFGNFGTTARQATLAFYKEEIGDQFDPASLHSIDDLLTRQTRDADAVKSLGRFFQSPFNLLRPLNVGDELVEWEDAKAAAYFVREVRETIVAEKDNYAEAYEKFNQADKLFIEIEQASALIEANFNVPFDMFSVPLNIPVKIQHALGTATFSRRAADATMKKLETAVVRRIHADLRLLDYPRVAEKIPEIESLRAEVPRILRAMNVLAGLFPTLMEYRLNGTGLELLLAQLENNRENAALIDAIRHRMRKMHHQLGQIFKRLVLEKYPLDHAQADISIADYLLTKLPTDEDLGALMGSYSALMDKMPALYLKLMSRLATVAEQVETVLGFPLLPDLQQKNGDGKGIEANEKGIEP